MPKITRYQKLDGIVSNQDKRGRESGSSLSTTTTFNTAKTTHQPTKKMVTDQKTHRPVASTDDVLHLHPPKKTATKIPSSVRDGMYVDVFLTQGSATTRIIFDPYEGRTTPCTYGDSVVRRAPVKN